MRKLVLVFLLSASSQLSMADVTPQVTVFAQAAGLEERIDKLQLRIDKGVSTGELSKGEATELQERLDRLITEKSAAKANGKMSDADRARLQAKADNISQAIKNKNNNKITSAADIDEKSTDGLENSHASESHEKLKNTPAKFDRPASVKETAAGDTEAQSAVNAMIAKAKAGNADAQLNLGLMYANGQGVPQDSQQAVSWFTKAANQGNAIARQNLSMMHVGVQSMP